MHYGRSLGREWRHAATEAELQQARAEPLPPELATPPDPHDRTAYFRWADRCREHWISEGASPSAADNLWGGLVARRLWQVDPQWVRPYRRRP
jgi:hypothetical protein